MHHNLLNIRKTAYGTLCAAKHITSIDLNCVTLPQPYYLAGFPWGAELEPWDLFVSERPHVRSVKQRIAIVHKCCCPSRNSAQLYGSRAVDIIAALSKFDAIIVGDNHQGFQHGKLFNCGTLMRRKIDEIEYRPRVGLLRADMTVEPHYLDCSRDKFADVKDLPKLVTVDLSEFLDELREAADATLNFRSTVQRACEQRGLPKPVVALVLKALDDD
jgi:hypothetical protein